MSDARRPTIAELRSIPSFADLPEAQLEWFAGQSEVREFAEGEIVFREGEPADRMYLVLEGELHGRARNAAPDREPYIVRQGDVGGMLPFSRMTHWGGTGRVEAAARLALFPAARFDELLQRMPPLGPRLVQIMADRVRENTRADLHRDKLLALGRLSAGLAHELNNPAAAAARAAAGLAAALADLRERTSPLAARLGAAPMEPLAECVNGLPAASQEDPLERSDREDAIAEWLAEHGVTDGWRWAPTFAESGAEPAWLDAVAADVPAHALHAALGWIEATLRARQLLAVVQASASRISDLVGAVKSYTYMDRAGAHNDVDVHAGLDGSLLMLGHKLRGRHVTRDYAPDLPAIRGTGSELNQVWTNLLDNAADATPPGGTIRITTRSQAGGVCVEIRDNGRGVPAALQQQIWEPFFTTKPAGQGTGLGLDIARRIVVQGHGGDIRLRSEPGDTRFTVVLPARPPG